MCVMFDVDLLCLWVLAMRCLLQRTIRVFFFDTFYICRLVDKRWSDTWGSSSMCKYIPGIVFEE